ncbi:hypothetical protein GH714_024760 [Hevea brasiliensis]|uniref:Transcription factor MYC/MYB N-terminal domain-containing protein n=1 Tax=Hevea brasiliensis TaxID=3981 RepID=A0A6A6NIT1_HEVBR|nr:hypothetical protein GH714_024760 [Hevea brasiliensis]
MDLQSLLANLSQQRILVWGDGYYNGAIKTRKTVQPMEVGAVEASLQRSQQLRDLYESLSAGETKQTARRPSAALSPEDLTESEWFYLMCVSFSFPPGTEGETGRNTRSVPTQAETVTAEPSELMQLEMSEDIRLGSPDDGSNNMESDFQLISSGKLTGHHQSRADSLRAESAGRWVSARPFV